MVEQLLTRYRDRLAGVLSCYDRIIITGTLPGVCYATGMTSFLHTHQIRIFDYARFAEPLRNRIREQARKLASEAGVTIQHVAKAHLRKEDLVAAVLKECGDLSRQKDDAPTGPGNREPLRHANRGNLYQAPSG